MTEDKRCGWPGNDPLMMEYHDREWGVPLHDDQRLFEFLVLDAFQAGLNWSIILKKRENFRRALDGFNPEIIAGYNGDKLNALLKDSGIIRNRLKILATVTNARAFLKVMAEFGTFNQYIWQFVHHQPIVNQWKTIAELPGRTMESDAMSKDLKKRGFKFAGSTICYAFMQATGMVNDHVVDCFRHREIINLYD